VRRLAEYLDAAGGSTLAQQLPRVAAQPGMTVERLVACALAELFKGRLAALEDAPCVLDAPPRRLAPAVPRRAGPEAPVPAGALARQPPGAGAGGPPSYKAALLAGGGVEGAAAAGLAAAVLQWQGGGGGGPADLSEGRVAALADGRLRCGSSAGESGAGVASGLAGLEAGVEHLQMLLAGMAALAERLPVA
jgi:hypothetical protein